MKVRCNVVDIFLTSIHFLPTCMLLLKFKSTIITGNIMKSPFRPDKNSIFYRETLSIIFSLDYVQIGRYVFPAKFQIFIKAIVLCRRRR